MTSPMPVEVRDYVDPHDTGYVVDTWLQSYHRGSKVVRRTRLRDYRDLYRRIIHRLLRQSVCLVAYDPGGHEAVGPRSHLLGHIVGEREGTRLVLHYVYVKQGRRRNGVAAKLVHELQSRLGTEGVTYTHETYLAERILGRKVQRGLDARWNPWLVWGHEAA